MEVHPPPPQQLLVGRKSSSGAGGIAFEISLDDVLERPARRRAGTRRTPPIEAAPAPPVVQHALFEAGSGVSTSVNPGMFFIPLVEAGALETEDDVIPSGKQAVVLEVESGVIPSGLLATGSSLPTKVRLSCAGGRFGWNRT
jgi:hypothetical protein